MAQSIEKSLPKMTVAEFMDWDAIGMIGKLELVDGVVRAMSPASGAHSINQANLAYLLGAHLRQNRPGCRVGTEAPIKPSIHANDNVRVPDLAVTCVASSPNSKLFPDPILIVEVLSPSNQHETWESIRALASLSTMREILVVDSAHIHVEILRRDAAGDWPNVGAVVEGGSFELTSIGATLNVADVYAGSVLT
jgi:Uma2 family endonuclease